MHDQGRSFRFGIFAKLFICGVTSFWFTVFSPIHADTFFLQVSWLVISLVVGWITAFSFATTITINDIGIYFNAAHLLPSRELAWSAIGYVKFDSVGGTGDAPSLDAYVLIPSDRRSRKRVLFGPWIANYKQLLREILERVSPDTKIDPDIFRIVRHRGEETIQHTARAIVLKQQACHSQGNRGKIGDGARSRS